MKVLSKDRKYKCVTCQAEFYEDEHDRLIQLYHNKAYCSFNCILKERYNVSPAIIEMLLKENWRF